MSTTDNTGMHPTNDTSNTTGEVKDELLQVSGASANAVKDVAESRFQQGREATTNQLDTVSNAIDEVAEKLEQSDSPFASYASELSDQLTSFSNKLSTSSIDDLVGGARSLARENPAAFMLGSMAIGLAASRFFKATGEQVSDQSDGSGATPGMHYVDHGSARRHGYKSGGMHDPGTETDSPRVNTPVSGAKEAMSPSTGESTVGHLNTGGTGHNDDVAGRRAQTAREDT